MLRLEIRGAADGPDRTALQPDDGEHPSDVALESSQSFVILVDRLTFDPKSAHLSLWHADELVFRLPASALLSIVFEVRDDPWPIPSVGLPLQHSNAMHATHASPAPQAAHVVAGHSDGPHAEPHRDLPSANTRWTTADEHRLLELHATGVPIDALARTFGRRKGAVRARLFKLRRAKEPGPESFDDPASAAPAQETADDATM